MKSSLVNINTATIKELGWLLGIGPIYGQNIVEHRHYSNVKEPTKKCFFENVGLRKNKGINNGILTKNLIGNNTFFVLFFLNIINYFSYYIFPS